MNTDRLIRENRRLRTSLVALLAALAGATMLGLADSRSAAKRTLEPVGITTDGTYVYVLFKDGSINRMEIEARERVNLCDPEFYHGNEKFKWNRFVEAW